MRKVLAVLILTLTFGLALIAAPASALSIFGLENSMVQFLLRQISTEGVFEVTAREVTEPEDGITAIEGLAIADSKGVWFTAERLDFSWNASRLLRGEVEFERLAMSGVEITRQPIPPKVEVKTEEPDEGPFVWPRSPLTFRIKEMRLDRVAIAKAVLGHAINFDAIGSARDEGDIQAVNLKLTRTDNVEGKIAFDYTRDFAKNSLLVHLDANEAPQGLIAALSGLPDDAASKLILVADGPSTDWQVKLDMALADTVTAQGQAMVSYEGPLAVDADFNVQPGAKLSPDIARLLGAQSRLRAVVNEDENGRIIIENARVNAPDLDLTAQGSYDKPTGAVDVALQLAARSALADPFEGVAFNGAAFLGRVHGTPGAMQAKGLVHLGGLRTAPSDLAMARLDIDIRQEGEDGATTRFDLRGNTRGLRIDKLGPDVLGPAQIALEGTLTGQDLDLTQTSIKSAAVALGLQGTANIETQDADMHFDLSTPDITPIAAAYGVADMAGAIKAEGQAKKAGDVIDLNATTAIEGLDHPSIAAQTLGLEATVRVAGERTDFKLRGQAEQMRIDKIEPDLIGQARLSADGAIDGDKLTLSEALLASGILELGARGDLDLAKGDGAFHYRLDVDKLAPIAARYDQNAAGAFSGEGDVVLSNNVPQITGNLAIAGLAYNDQTYGDLQLDHDVSIGDEPQGNIALALAGSPYGDTKASTDFKFAQPQLEIQNLDLLVAGASLRGDIDLDTTTTLAQGKLTLNAGNLAKLSKLAGTPLGGALNGTIALSTPNNRQDAKIDLNASGLQADTARIASLKLNAVLSNLLGTPGIKTTLLASDITSGGLALQQTRITANGSLAALDIQAGLNGEMDQKTIDSQLQARANLAGGTQDITVSSLVTKIDEETFQLGQPLRIRSNGGRVSLSDLLLSLPDNGRIEGDLISHGNGFSGKIDVAIPDLGVAKRLADAPILAGGITAQADFDTRRGRAKADIDLASQGLRLKGIEGAGVLDIAAKSDWNGRTANVQASVDGNFGDPFLLSGSVPLVSGGGGVPSVPAHGPVAGTVKWNGRLGDLWALVPAAGHILTGKANIDLGVTGDIAAPQLTGDVSIDQGGYQNLDLGTILTDLKLATRIKDGGLGLSLSASDGNTGTVTAKGDVALDASGIDLRIDMQDAVLVRRDDAKARVDGGIDIKGPVTALDVAGKIGIDTAEIRLVNNSPPNVVTLGDVLIKGAPEPEEDAGSSTIALDLAIDAPGRIFVRGRGLDSEWKMALKVTGDAAKPRVTGKIEKVRGGLDLLGKNFELTRGTVSFAGGRQIDPRIDVILSHSASDLTGNILVTGRASDPKLGFSSSPALPEDEVMPRTLFGKSSQSLSGSQAIQLALGLATLMDGSGGTLDKVRGAIGVDQLRVEQDSSGNTSVAAAKEVTEGVFVGAKQSIGDSGTSGFVEIEILDDFTIDAEVDPEDDSSVGVNWKHDF